MRERSRAAMTFKLLQDLSGINIQGMDGSFYTLQVVEEF